MALKLFLCPRVIPASTLMTHARSRPGGISKGREAILRNRRRRASIGVLLVEHFEIRIVRVNLYVVEICWIERVWPEQFALPPAPAAVFRVIGGVRCGNHRQHNVIPLAMAQQVSGKVVLMDAVSDHDHLAGLAVV